MTKDHDRVTGETMPRKPKAGVAAEVTLTLRMTDHDRALLDRLIALRVEELAELGADEIEVTAASYVRGLIRREAKAKGVTAALAAQEASAKPPAQAPAPEAPPKPTTRTPEEAEAAEVHAAFLRAVEKGETQAQIAEKTGIDAGALSKFKKNGSGLSPEKIKKLRRILL
jgi:hypothetical protein